MPHSMSEEQTADGGSITVIAQENRCRGDGNVEATNANYILADNDQELDYVGDLKQSDPSHIRKCSSFLAGWKVSNLIQGTGTLAIPYAVQQSGWAAVIMIFLVALLCCHTGKLLIQCLYEISDKTGTVRTVRKLRCNYLEVAEAVMGRKGFIIISVIQNCIDIFGGVIVYIVLLGHVTATLLQQSTGLGLREWAAISCCLILPSLFVTKKSIVSWLSKFSVFTLLATLLVLFAFSFTKVSQWSLSHISSFDAKKLPIAFGIVVFSFFAHSSLPAVENSMEKPQRFGSVMNYSFLLAAAIKAALGVFMALNFGEDTSDVPTVNLPVHPIFSKVINSLLIVNVLLTIPLKMLTVSFKFDEYFLKYFPHLNNDTNFHWVWVLITRPMLLCFSLFVAIMVPYFGILLSIMGSFTGASLCFIFPCYFHIKLKWRNLRPWELIVDILIILFGVLFGGTGLYFTIKALSAYF